MNLEEACACIATSLEQVDSALDAIAPAERADIYKMAVALVGPTSIFQGMQIPTVVPRVLYDRAVQRGYRLERLQSQYADLLLRILDAQESILSPGIAEDAMDRTVASVGASDPLSIHRRLDHALRTKRLVIDPIREIVGLRPAGGSKGPQSAPTQPPPETIVAHTDLSKGHSYLIIGERPDVAFATFAHFVKEGYHGLSITRYYPGKLRTRFELEKTPMLWLSHTEGEEEHVDPSNLGILINILKEFFKQTDQGVVLIEGLEYLIIQNGFETVLRFLQYINEHVVTRGIILLIPLNADSLHPKEAALIKSEMELPGAAH